MIRFLCMTMVRRLRQTLKALFDSLCKTMCYYLNESMTPIVRFNCSTNLNAVLDCTRFIEWTNRPIHDQHQHIICYIYHMIFIYQMIYDDWLSIVSDTYSYFTFSNRCSATKLWSAKNSKLWYARKVLLIYLNLWLEILNWN